MGWHVEKLCEHDILFLLSLYKYCFTFLMSYHIIVYPSVRLELHEKIFLRVTQRFSSFTKGLLWETPTGDDTKHRQGGAPLQGLLRGRRQADDQWRGGESLRGVGEPLRGVGDTGEERRQRRACNHIVLIISSQRWYTNKRWAIHFFCCCFSIGVYSVEDLNWFQCGSGSREPDNADLDPVHTFPSQKAKFLHGKYTLCRK